MNARSQHPAVARLRVLRKDRELHVAALRACAMIPATVILTSADLEDRAYNECRLAEIDAEIVSLRAATSVLSTMGARA